MIKINSFKNCESCQDRKEWIQSTMFNKSFLIGVVAGAGLVWVYHKVAS